MNLVTGDYSRGAAGYWVENGEIAHPVEEITIAGNLKDMFLGIAAVGSDTVVRGVAPLRLDPGGQYDHRRQLTPAARMAKPILIEIASDVICPWCYIGKRRLEKALASLEGRGRGAHRVAAVPAQSGHARARACARADYRRAQIRLGREGSARWTRASRTKARARASPSPSTACERTPNTVAAHQLIDLAQKQGRGDAVVDALFRAYFEEARDIGDRGRAGGHRRAARA